jgi:hypothetical protein|tara:strand:- start:74 stop:307 length:234 start_codon:yes stop_codon:yes gene_type:complete
MSIQKPKRTEMKTNKFLGWKVPPTEKVQLIVGWYSLGYSIDKILTRKTCVFTRKEVGFIIEAYHANNWAHHMRTVLS